MSALRVLIAETHLEFRSRLRNLLLRSRPDVVVWDVADGADLIQKARELQPDIILLEYSLRVINGLEAAELIRQSNSSVRMLLISFHRGPELLSRAKSAGLNGYIWKPELAEKLLSAIKIILEGGTFFLEPADLDDK